MNKLKLFVENFLVYGIGGIISKIIPFIMLPIVTRLMPDSTYFGLSDLLNTITSFASALAIMGMYDAMYRMFFEKEEKDFKEKTCSTAFLFSLGTSLFVFITLLIFRKYIAQMFLGNVQYSYLIYFSAIATLVGATNSIISAPTRMQNKRTVFLVTNAVGPILSYSISIPLLLRGHYIIALPLASVISNATMEISFWILNKKWFNFRKFDFKLLKQMLVIAVPTLPVFLVYWVFNSCDRLMIVNMIGMGAAGIYSVGSKLGHASQLIYTAFAGGWQYFAFSTMKEKNQVESNSAIFEYLGVISFVATAFVSAWSYWLYKVLFPAEYISGYIISPYLFFAPLLQMLFQVSANQFIVIKKTWPIALILSGGAILNIIINFVLIPLLGIEGAAIATLFGYLISNVICTIVLCKMKLMVISKRLIVAVLVMGSYMLGWRVYFSKNIIMGTILAIIITVIFAYLYKDDLLKIFKGIRGKNI